jgi:acylphosphatase
MVGSERVCRQGVMKRVRAVVSGRVQGVWYRAHTRDKAVELGVRGYVRNLRDGTVEIMAEGEAAQIDAFLEWAQRGPPLAEVAGVAVAELEPGDGFSGFQVRY